MENKKLSNVQSTFVLDGVTYTMTKTGYCYKSTGTFDKKGQEMNMRIAKHVFEQKFDEFIANGNDQGSAFEQDENIPNWNEAQNDEWQKISDEELNNRMTMKEDADRKTEESFNKKETKKRVRKSKDIAWSGDGIIAQHTVTLTSKQVDFIRHIPDTCFYDGLDSTPWCDVLADEIGGQFANKPMTTGAMISTLKEKGIIYTQVEKVNGHKSKYFGFTERGKKIAKALGLK